MSDLPTKAAEIAAGLRRGQGDALNALVAAGGYVVPGDIARARWDALMSIPLTMHEIGKEPFVLFDADLTETDDGRRVLTVAISITPLGRAVSEHLGGRDE